MSNRSQGSQSPQLKDREQYEALREEGMSKEKAARISNASARESRSAVGRRGGSHPPYEEWRVPELREKAAEVGISGRSTMTKEELIQALRHH